MKALILCLLITTTGCSYPRYELQKLDNRDRMQDFIRPDETTPSGTVSDILRYTQNLRQTMDRGDYWQYPRETIEKGGDCEDKAFLLLSMLIKAGVSDAQGVKGHYLGQGHMWVEYNGCILDPSRRNTGLIPIDKSIGYVPYFKFDKDSVYYCNIGKERE